MGAVIKAIIKGKLSFKNGLEFNKTIFPFALVGYEIVRQRGP